VGESAVGPLVGHLNIDGRQSLSPNTSIIAPAPVKRDCTSLSAPQHLSPAPLPPPRRRAGGELKHREHGIVVRVAACPRALRWGIDLR